MAAVFMLLLLAASITGGGVHGQAITRESFTRVECESGRPAGCTDELPADCAEDNIQRWLPQSTTNIPGACGACYYCRAEPTFVEKEDCPVALCPVISPLCNKVQPAIVFNDGRRCRGCSECVSFNQCPELQCPNRIRGCDVYGPNFRYINGQLCPACRVCNRYKGNLQRPPLTPLPCPAFNVTACPLVDKCLEYQERFVNLGEGRECQICPECLRWADPNEDIPSYNLGGESNNETPQCEDIVECILPANCERTEMVLRIVNETTCRGCDRCTSFRQRENIEGGNDAVATTSAAAATTDATTEASTETTTEAPTETTTEPPTEATTEATTQAPRQTCPDLSRCPAVTGCNRIVNTTLRIATDEICQGCPACQGRASNCPIERCPGLFCRQTAIFARAVNGSLCEVCVCTDLNQDCSSFTCPPTGCVETVPGSVIIGDRICDCPVCSQTNNRNEADGGDDGTDRFGPDERERPRVPLPNVVTMTSTPTTTMSTTTMIPTTTTIRNVPAAIPNCEDLIPQAMCASVDCVVVHSDILNINGVDCYGCPRCPSDLPKVSNCPELSCPSIHCGDSEDIAAGRRYRESQTYNVSGEICQGCSVCLNCPRLQCPRLNPSCLRYTRRTDSRGCVLCPFCEIWDSTEGPPLVGRLGFLQSIASAFCVTSHGTLQDTLPGLLANICTFNENVEMQQQLWKFTGTGLMQVEGSQFCASYYSAERPLVIRICNASNRNMIWTLEKDNRYPQFFKVRHQRTDLCLDVESHGSRIGGTALTLSPCEPFTRINGTWSEQWWKFEEYSSTL